VPANNRSTSVIPLLPASAIPALDAKTLALRAMVLCVIAAIALRR